MSFASNFSSITTPWTLAWRKRGQTVWAWRSSHWETFHHIKKGWQLCKEILGFSKYFAVFMAASDTHLETTLQQRNKENIFYPVSDTSLQKVISYEKELWHNWKAIPSNRASS